MHSQAEERAGDDVIALSQQRKHDRADRGHARAEAGGGDAVFHPVDLLFQRRRRRIALPAVGVALRPPLEHRRQLARIAVAVRDRKMQRLVQRAVLDRGVAIGMQDRGREAALPVQISHVLFPCAANKKPVGLAAKRVLCAPPGIPRLERTSL